jgi:2',5'-phosphodiesterase
VANDDWVPDVQPPLRSAYAVKNGAEPDFTNYAKVKDSPTFIATLDYIFHSPEWTVESVRNLPHRDNVAGPLPNADEPSDHLVISAELSLPPLVETPATESIVASANTV